MVGRPFYYSWWAAVDELGRGIASDSVIRYLPSPEYDMEDWIP